VIPGVLTANEAQELSGHSGRVVFELPLIARFTSIVTDLTGAVVTPESYAAVECKSDGHAWHVDTGDSNHMPWCQWSASVLLSPPDRFTGGMFQFRNPDADHKEYLGAMIYSSDQEHRVTPHEGVRKVLLVFLGSQNGK
jgi:hypothetical protein